ncbi:MAG: Ig-like domain repeat protein, partial [Methanobrevibacter sp.]|nr:Ig-like domain repeat protein [Methanobrevibacter sp.]
FVSATGNYSFNGSHVVWNVGTINRGSNVTLILVVRVNGTGNISNSANVTSNETNIGNNSTGNNSTNFTVNATVNLTIDKFSNVTGLVNVGDLVEYTIVVTNFGPDNATGVVVTDALDPRLIFVSATGNYSFNGSHVVWNVGTINRGSNVTLILVVRVNGTGNINNGANVTSNETNIGNNSTGNNSTNFTVNATVNLTIDKTSNASEFMSVGDLVEYTIVVRNYGPDNATGVVVTDALDPRLLFVSATGNYSFNGSHVIWNVGTINNGNNVTLILVVRVNGTGNISNSASVTSNETNIGNNSTSGNNSTNFTVNATVNLTIDKFSNVTGLVNLGDLVEYTIVVTNYGPDNATGVVVVDVLDPRLIFVSATGNYSFNGSHIVWNVGTINRGSNVTLILIVRVNGTGSINNSASVTSNETNIGNNSTGNNSSNFTVNATVNLTIDKTSNASEFMNVGDLVEYTIIVRNYGPDNATGVVVTDALDPRLLFVSATGNYSFNGSHVVWNVGTINNGNNVTLILVVRVNGTGNISNSANVTSNETNIGNNTTSGNNSTNFTVNATVNLTIDKTSNASEFMNVGDLVEYTIIVRNYGPDNATSVVVTDVLDPRLIFVSATGNYSFNGSHVVWNVGTINRGSNATLILVVRVNGTGNISNSASVTSNETNIGNNTTSGNNGSNFTVNSTVNLTITKNHNITGSVTIGDYVLYTIVVTNYGPDNATGVVVVDVLDPRLVYVISSAGGIYNPLTRTISWNVGSINIGDNVTLTVTVQINGSGNISNFANLTVNEINIGENGTEENGTNLNILKLGINSSIIVPTSSKFGEIVNINGTLLDEKGNPVANANITVVSAGQPYYVTTNAAGFWNLSYIPTSTGNLSIVVSWIGNDIYNGFSNSTTLNVLKLDTNSSIIVPASFSLGIQGSINGTLLDENGNPVANVIITIVVDGQSFTVATNAVGFWTFSYAPQNVGNLTIVVSWLGNDIYNGFTNSSNLNVNKLETNIIVVDVPLRLNFTSNLIADLHDERGYPVATNTVDFYVNGAYIGSNVTNANGRVFLSFIPISLGNHLIEARYNGSSTYESSNGSIIIEVTIMNSSIVIGSVTTKPFINTTIPITLRDEFGNPIVNEIITVTIDGQEYNLTTNTNGIAFLYYTPSIAGDFLISAYFNGTTIYLNSSSTGVLIVDKFSTSLLLNNVVLNALQNADFAATLVDEFGNLLSDMVIEVFIDGISIGQFKTDNYGRAFINYDILSQGVYSINTVFLGDNNYATTSSNSTLTIRPVKTTLIVSTVQNQDNSISFVARLFDEYNKPLANEIVVFLLDGHFMGIVPTNSNGIATFNYSFISEGIITAEFLGNSIYRESLDSRFFTINASSNESNDDNNGSNGTDNNTNGSKPGKNDTDNDFVDPDTVDPDYYDYDVLSANKLASPIAMYNVGNPMLILVLSLVSILLIGFWRKKI